MPKLYLKFNDSFEYVKLKLEGSGTLIIDEKKEHVDVLCYELVNYIKHKHPSSLVFDGVIHQELIDMLSKSGVHYDIVSKKLTYTY